MYVSIPCACSAHRDQKGASDYRQLWATLWVLGVSWVLWKTSSVPNRRAFSPCVCMHVEPEVDFKSSPQSPSTLFSEAGSTRGDQNSPIQLLYIAGLFWGSLISAPEHWNYRYASTPPSIYMGSEGPNAVPPTYMASTLLYLLSRLPSMDDSIFLSPTVWLLP